MAKRRSKPKGQPKQDSWLSLAFRRNVVQRALVMSVIVGCVLVSINHGSCIVHGKFGAMCVLQSFLTVLVPYAVSTVSSVMALRDQD